MSQDESTMISRRNLLMKLGLAAGAAYVAPTLAGLDIARASTGSGGGGGNSGGGRSSGPSRPSLSDRGRSSGPSRPRSSGNRGASQTTRWRWNNNRKRWVRARTSR